MKARSKHIKKPSPSRSDFFDLQRYAQATFILCAFFFLYERLVHGILLISLYEKMPSIWRDFSYMEAHLPLAICFQLALAAWSTFVFTQIYKKGGLKNGLFFGLFFGVFAGILTGSWYLWLPVSAKLGLGWFASGIGEGLGAGAILGILYRS